MFLSAQNEAKVNSRKALLISKLAIVYFGTLKNLIRKIPGQHNRAHRSSEIPTQKCPISQCALRNSWIFSNAHIAGHDLLVQMWILLRTRLSTAAGAACDTARDSAPPVRIRRPVYGKGPGFCPASILPHKNTRLRFAMEANAGKNRSNNSTGLQFTPEFKHRRLLMKFLKPTASFTICCASSLESPRGIFPP